MHQTSENKVAFAKTFFLGEETFYESLQEEGKKDKELKSLNQKH